MINIPLWVVSKVILQSSSGAGANSNSNNIGPLHDITYYDRFLIKEYIALITIGIVTKI